MKQSFIPEDAPFSGEQRVWLGGFLAGLQSRAAITENAGALASQAAATPSLTLDILYGTQTGNAETVAMDAAEMARVNGFAPTVHSMDDVSMEQLAAMERVIVAVSTYGEGEMPDNAQLFWDELSSTSAPRLENMKFAVLALGDTGYDEFCQAGKLIDMRFEQLGAKRLASRIDCDVDYEDAANGWLTETLPLANDDSAGGITAPAPAAKAAGAEKSKWSRKNPYGSKVVENRLLSGKKSAKEIRHFSFDLGDSGLSYEAGDALGVMPVNDPALVTALLERLGEHPEAAVAGHDKPLGELLSKQFEIARPSKEIIAAVAEQSGDDELRHVYSNGDKEALEAFLWGRDTLDLLNLNPKLSLSATELLGLLKPLQHRAYSISSSPKAHDNEVHLTVAAVRWKREGREHKGVCSTFLSDMIAEGDTAGIFVSPNKSFCVPSDADAPMIMVGPGTGIAPFRAFLEERQATGAKGKNWLFFGDQHRDCDFIYEDEIAIFSKASVLNRLDLAFSRDQSEKIYVQSRMRENGKELFSWLEEGGHFYVCGDATRMAKDVEQALLDVIAAQGGLSEDGALEYLTRLKREKRYLRDVY